MNKAPYISPVILSLPLEVDGLVMSISTDGISAPGLWLGTESDCHIYDDLI